MRTRFLLTLIATFLVATLVPGDAVGESPEITTIIVVRHAEKQIEHENPGLTLVGEERSHHLRDLVLKAGVTGVYASQYRRTQETVEPLASALGLKTRIVDAGKHAELAEKILSEHLGGVVVVAGHSNTVPDIVAALGAQKPAPIDESQYGNLFVVTVSDSGSAAALRLQF